MIESIITEYLRHNRRLVIPELGAFLKKEDGQTVFVPFLNKDDGVLTGEVRKAYGTSTAEAEAIAAQYAESVWKGIDTHGAYLIAPLGSLKKDPNGILYLDAADLTAKPVVKEKAPAVKPEPEAKTTPQASEEKPVVPVPENRNPEPAEPGTLAQAYASEADEVKTVGNSVEAPKTFYDILMEKQEEQAPATDNLSAAPSPTSQRRQETPKTVSQPATARSAAPAPARRPEPAPAKGKRGDLVLVIAVVVAVIAIIAMIYAYSVVDLPRMNLN